MFGTRTLVLTLPLIPKMSLVSTLFLILVSLVFTAHQTCRRTISEITSQ